MKLLIFPMIIALFFAISACRKKDTEAITLKIPYSCELTIKSDEKDSNTYKASLSRKENSWQATYTEPESISGMTITFSDDSYKIKLDELEFDAKRDELPDSAISTMIISALDKTTLSSNVEYETNDGSTVAKGTVGEKDYELIFKDNIPQSLKISGYTVTFLNFKS